MNDSSAEQDRERELLERLTDFFEQRQRALSAASPSRRLVMSRDWRWKFLWRADPEAYRLCIFGVLAEWIR